MFQNMINILEYQGRSYHKQINCKNYNCCRPHGFKVVPHPALQAQPNLPVLGVSPSHQTQPTPVFPYYQYYTPYLLPPPVPYFGPIVNVTDVKTTLGAQPEKAASIPVSNLTKAPKTMKNTSKRLELSPERKNKIPRGPHSNMAEPEVNTVGEVLKRPDHHDKSDSSSGISDEDDHAESDSSSRSSEEDSSSSGESEEDHEKHSMPTSGTDPQHVGMSVATLRERNGSHESDDMNSDEDSDTDEDDDDESTESSETMKGLRVESGEIIPVPSRERSSEEDASKSKNPRRQSGKNKSTAALSEGVSKSREANSSKDLDTNKDIDEKSTRKDKSGSKEDRNTIRNVVKPFPPYQNKSNLNETNTHQKHAQGARAAGNFTSPVELDAKKFKPIPMKLPTLFMWLTDQMKKSVIGRAVLSTWPSLYQDMKHLGQQLVNSTSLAWETLTTEPAVPGNEETRILAILTNTLFDNIGKYSKHH